MNKSQWIWMPHPGHLCVSRDCKFHLNTYVGDYIVSTVGEYLPDSQVREIYAQSRGITLEGKGDNREADYMQKFGYEDIGYGRKYETMVFKAKKSNTKCCPYRMESGSEVDSNGYNDPNDATEGHMAMCEKWSQM